MVTPPSSSCTCPACSFPAARFSPCCAILFAGLAAALSAGRSRLTKVSRLLRQGGPGLLAQQPCGMLTAARARHSNDASSTFRQRAAVAGEGAQRRRAPKGKAGREDSFILAELARWEHLANTWRPRKTPHAGVACYVRRKACGRGERATRGEHVRFGEVDQHDNCHILLLPGCYSVM
jgi:hypothetical protein